MFHAPIVSTMKVSSGVQGPNPLDFRSVMKKIRGKTASFFFISSHACYSSLVFSELIVMSERLICFNMKKDEGGMSYVIEAT